MNEQTLKKSFSTESSWDPSRRYFFQECGVGVAKIALASLLGASTVSSPLLGAEDGLERVIGPGQVQAPHFPPTAKRVIYLFMAGAPSQLELFDYKPKLAELAGKPIPPSVIAGQR